MSGGYVFDRLHSSRLQNYEMILASDLTSESGGMRRPVILGDRGCIKTQFRIFHYRFVFQKTLNHGYLIQICRDVELKQRVHRNLFVPPRSQTMRVQQLIENRFFQRVDR